MHHPDLVTSVTCQIILVVACQVHLGKDEAVVLVQSLEDSIVPHLVEVLDVAGSAIPTYLKDLDYLSFCFAMIE